ncbi:hypothetical protein EVAR_73742_1 [Eumeta japonica]|uniref:Uncharacterized protein n=1 Tax=Eumeta variegata TaxID=151549 RepID=A0A4C1TAI2_EUMVA|nr:hypothetical protein EVAR_73742_1 [Eumeta japonica]
MQIAFKGIDSCVDPLEPMFRVELEPNDTKLKKMRFILFMISNTCCTVKLLWRSPTNVQGQFSATTVRNMGTQKHIASCQQFALCVGNYMVRLMGCPVYSVVKLSMKPKPVSDQARNVFLALSLIPKWPNQPQTSIRLRTPGDIELGIENISKMMNEAVHHASTTYQQPSFNRIFSADIQRLVSEREEQEGVAATQISSIKSDLENVQHN